MLTVSHRETVEVGERKLSSFFFTFIFAAFGFFAIYQIQSRNEDSRANRQMRLAIPASVVSHYGFGQNMAISDLFWLRLLQDISYKESEKVHLGVVYRMLDVITTLDPRFMMAYTAGLSSLSVLVSDAEGARILYERAIVNYPDNWHLLFAAGYHNLYEVGDCARAADLFSRAAAKGAPYWVGFLAEKLYTRTGQYVLAKAALNDAMNYFEDEKSKRLVREKLSDLEKNRDVAADTDKSPLRKCRKPE